MAAIEGGSMPLRHAAPRRIECLPTASDPAPASVPMGTC
jgi:hypothetical protein